jgi:hypothetical protein
MNQETFDVMTAVTEKVMRNLMPPQEIVCVIGLANPGGGINFLSDWDYMIAYGDDSSFQRKFEERAAWLAKEAGVTRWVLAVPMVWHLDGPTVSMRAISPHPLREGEHEVIAVVTFDGSDGVDYGVVPFARRPDGTPVFDDPHELFVNVSPRPFMPGYTLIKEMTTEVPT